MERNMSRRSDMHGFTLIELMITLALLTIVLGLAVPNFIAFIQKTRLQEQTDDLIATLQYARGEAVTRRTTAEVIADDDGPWVVRVAGQSARELSHNTSQARMDADAASITYRANGTATPALIIVCRDDSPETAYVVEVRASGAPVRHERGKGADGNALTSCTL
ncbi:MULTISPECIES: GspH/FimT family pseudopilin [Stutzerimonas stutzeri subgroup]|uniref:GspH/FimT family pseudopilin n=2 Tax=Stutzerimonas stutzeri subgroup TaxID=578833 RepID=UPI000356E952|nr:MULTISPECIES: GspH/FimT family pseudopilin [Stutzerimonas stutzeri subgroup]EPL63258.1 Tfp pilus assembly protein FimT-like protein [Stutzerimonas stutzeri B1SMN1]MDI9736008.1 GspH/FimT family pseudopilin [Stutzerimonas stutzeri]